jgi:hypothetical protein
LPSYRKVAQRVDEALAIRIIHDDQFAPVTTIHDVRQQTRLSICGLGRARCLKSK